MMEQVRITLSVRRGQPGSSLDVPFPKVPRTEVKNKGFNDKPEEDDTLNNVKIALK